VTPRDTIARLETLLERVRKNAASPARAVAPAVVAASAVVAAPAAPVAPPAVSVQPLVDRRALVDDGPPTPRPVVEEPIPPTEAAMPPTEFASPPAWPQESPSAVQARPVTLPPEELSDDDLLEVTTIPPEPEETTDVEVSIDEPETDVAAERDEPPVSSSRTKVAETIDEALASAVEMDGEHEVPVKTPPPESGPQAAGPPPQGLEAPRIPDVEALEADLLPPVSVGPTAEQLGETIELEPPRGPSLEIDVTPELAPVPERAPEELEVTLPRAQMPSGTYDLPGAPAPSPPLPPVEQRPVESSVPPEPRPTARPELGAAEIAKVVLGRPSQSASFLDVLDRSLTL